MTKENYENKILEAVEILVENAVSNAKYDKTVKGIVSRCIDRTIGKYIIKYQDSSFYAYSYNDITLSPGTEVYVLIPGNDMAKEKTIIGSVEKLGTDYMSILEGDKKYEIVGKNSIYNDKVFSLCSYTPNQIKILYDKESNIDLINLDTFSFKEYLQQSSSIICGAKIRTNLPAEQRFKGDYGLVFELEFANDFDENLITKSYAVDINQMIGNPYELKDAVRQYAIFNIDSKNFKDIKKIFIYQKDFPNIKEEEGIEEDIFFSELEINCANRLSQEELNTYSLSLITPKGSFFDDNDSEENEKIIEAQVRIKGNIISEKSDLIKYYWFIEDGTVINSNPFFNIYGGKGWKCLNDYNIIKSKTETTPEIIEWVPSKAYKKIKKKDHIAKETVYKCVAIYKDISLVKTIRIKNYSSNYNIEIKNTYENSLVEDTGHPTLICYVNDQQEKSSDYTYVWTSIDNTGNFLSISETKEKNEEYNSAWLRYNQLEEEIRNEDTLPGKVEEELISIRAILDKYEKITRVEKNTIFHLNAKEIILFSTYKCSVYYKGVFIGSTSIAVSNNDLSKGQYVLIINNGTQAFKYNQDGMFHINNDEKKESLGILPLTFSIYDAFGIEISSEKVKKENIKWFIPNTNTLLEAFEYNGAPNIKNSRYDIYKEKRELRFNIENFYTLNKNNNDIILQVKYQDTVLTAKSNFIFTKEGDPGTNGTNFICRIVPNSVEDIHKYPMIFSDGGEAKINYTPREPGKWFRAQLWENGEKIFDLTESGSSANGKHVSLTWSILRNKYTMDKYDDSNITISPDTGICSATRYKKDSFPANIIQCQIRYNGVYYYGYLPLISSYVKKEYWIELKNDTGFRQAVYNSQGTNPKYNSNSPFDISVFKTIDGVLENITDLRADQYRINCEWNILGKIYNPENDYKMDNINLGKTFTQKDLSKTQFMIKPNEKYDGECVTNAVECQVRDAQYETIGLIHIPIHLMLNRFSNSYLNEWNGNDIQINSEGGMILAPQVGAGFKENDNSFTGVLMGSAKEGGSFKKDTGLLGYSKGQRSFFLDAKTGRTELGKRGQGQVIIDPTQNRAEIRSGNYDPKKKTGMLIDLTTPRIDFGSGNFAVDKDGNVTIKSLETKIEEVKNSINFTDKKFTGTNLIKNSAMKNGKKYWLDSFDIDFEEKGSPPTTLKEGGYWICTADYEMYKAGKVYVYKQGAFELTGYKPKELMEMNSLLEHTNPYDNEGTIKSTLSKIMIEQAMPKTNSHTEIFDGTYPSHLFCATNEIDLTEGEQELFVGFKLINKIKTGVIQIGVFYLNDHIKNIDFSKNIYSMYEDSILITPGEIKDIEKINIYSKIPSKKISAIVVGNVEPEDKEQKWINTNLPILRVSIFDKKTQTWVLTEDRDTYYDIKSKHIFTYRPYIGSYYDTGVLSTNYNITNAAIVFSIYPMPVIKMPNSSALPVIKEQIPSKAFCYGLEDSGKVVMPVYKDNDFLGEYKDTGFSLQEIEQNPLPNVFYPLKIGVPPTGGYNFGDLIATYSTVPVDWMPYPGEIYGDSFKADSSGIQIQSGKNTMTIDEDEIVAEYGSGVLKEKIFYLSGIDGYLKKLKTEEIEIQNPKSIDREKKTPIYTVKEIDQILLIY